MYTLFGRWSDKFHDAMNAPLVSREPWKEPVDIPEHNPIMDLSELQLIALLVAVSAAVILFAKVFFL